MSFRKNRAERKIKKITRQLEELKEEGNPDILHPVENMEATMVIRTREQQIAELTKKLEKYEAILAACINDEAETPEIQKAKAEKRIAEIEKELKEIDQREGPALDRPLQGTDSTMIVQANREKRDELKDEMVFCKKIIENSIL